MIKIFILIISMFLVGCFDTDPSADSLLEGYYKENLPPLSTVQREGERERCLQFKKSWTLNCKAYMASVSAEHNHGWACKPMMILLQKYPNGCEILYGE
jgi:hypothetical protein